MVVTEAFRPMVLAQAKGRGFQPRLLVVKHPLGGLSETELEQRIEQGAASLITFLEAG
jgi:hypothetical protein